MCVMQVWDLLGSFPDPVLFLFPVLSPSWLSIIMSERQNKSAFSALEHLWYLVCLSSLTASQLFVSQPTYEHKCHLWPIRMSNIQNQWPKETFHRLYLRCWCVSVPVSDLTMMCVCVLTDSICEDLLEELVCNLVHLIVEVPLLWVPKKNCVFVFVLDFSVLQILSDKVCLSVRGRCVRVLLSWCMTGLSHTVCEGQLWLKQWGVAVLIYTHKYFHTFFSWSSRIKK